MTSSCPMAVIEFDFALKNPVDRIRSSSSSGFAAAYAAASGYFAKTVGVTMLTRLSVLCAERTVATEAQVA